MKVYPPFSVVMPLYNKARYVARSISSVLNQTFDDFELIIIDDASTDESVSEAMKFDDPRIQFLFRNEPGAGGYAARNKGIKHARGKWICFLDADDKWYPNHLKTAHEAKKKFTKCNLIILGFRCHKINTRKDIFGGEQQKTLTRSEALELYSKRDFIHINSVVSKKELLIDSGLFPVGKCNRGGDSDLFLRLLLNSDNVAICPDITSCYFMESSGVISDISTTSLTHPVFETVQESLKQSFSSTEKFYLKKLANRKSFLWSIGRKRFNSFKIAEFKNFYFNLFSLHDYLQILILLLPQYLYKSLKPFKKIFKNKA